MADYELVRFEAESLLLVVCSTTGDGDPPSAARGFYDCLDAASALADDARELPADGPANGHAETRTACEIDSAGAKPATAEREDGAGLPERAAWSRLHYATLTLGDSGYPHFCRTGRAIDAALARAQAVRLEPVVLIDQEDWGAIDAWIERRVAHMPRAVLEWQPQPRADYLASTEAYVERRFAAATADSDASGNGPTRQRPFAARLLERTALSTVPGKCVVHVVLDVSGAGITWAPGDALGVYPLNLDDDVSAVLRAVRCRGHELVSVLPAGAFEPLPPLPTPLRTLLQRYYDLRTVRAELIDALGKHAAAHGRTDGKAQHGGHTTGAALAARLLARGTNVAQNTELAAYIRDRSLADVLNEFTGGSATPFPVSELLRLLRPLQPRYYSISSSRSVDANRLTLTVAQLVFKTTHGQQRTGVASTFLAERLPINAHCYVFVRPNADFRLPERHETPIIMVGPGTGVAPFRAFLQERSGGLRCEHTAAVPNGHAPHDSRQDDKDRLYFGCWHQSGDFLYCDELRAHEKRGDMALFTAFSRDQPHKVYVQHLLQQHDAAIWALLDRCSAHFYVCGDAANMARDVERTLLGIAQRHGRLSLSDAQSWLRGLRRARRYQCDVWVV